MGDWATGTAIPGIRQKHSLPAEPAGFRTSPLTFENAARQFNLKLQILSFHIISTQPSSLSFQASCLMPHPFKRSAFSPGPSGPTLQARKLRESCSLPLSSRRAPAAEALAGPGVAGIRFCPASIPSPPIPLRIQALPPFELPGPLEPFPSAGLRCGILRGAYRAPQSSSLAAPGMARLGRCSGPSFRSGWQAEGSPESHRGAGLAWRPAVPWIAPRAKAFRPSGPAAMAVPAITAHIARRVMDAPPAQSPGRGARL